MGRLVVARRSVCASVLALLISCPPSAYAQSDQGGSLPVPLHGQTDGRRIFAAPVIEIAHPQALWREAARQSSPPRPVTRKSSRKLMWILIGVGAGAAGAALALAGGSSGGSVDPPLPAQTITIGAPTIGAPQ